VVPFCQDQHGSRFIQQRLEVATGMYVCMYECMYVCMNVCTVCMYSMHVSCTTT
jgi:hypothetical protein